MSSRIRIAQLGRACNAAQVAGSQIALAGSNYLVLALAARQLDAAGFAALSSYYLLINTVGRGLFAAVELETTRSVALAIATGGSIRLARADAVRHTALLLVGALILLLACTPLLGAIIGSGASAVGLLMVGAVAMAASYLVRGPLAGERRYTAYAATFWIEAGAGIMTAWVLIVVGVGNTSAWIAVFALSPILAAALLSRAGSGIRADIPTAEPPLETSTKRSHRELLYSAALLLAGQGVWNLAPVLVTARLAETPAIAAGFVTVAVVLRAPVLVFPAMQALLLPAITAMVNTGETAAVRRATRTLSALLAVGGAVWLVLAVFAVPTVAHVVFAATTTPPTWVLLVLAISTVVGAAAQVAQTYLIAVRRQREVAITWIAGLTVLLMVGLLVAPPLVGAALGQVAAAALVLVLLSAARHRSYRIGVRP